MPGLASSEFAFNGHVKNQVLHSQEQTHVLTESHITDLDVKAFVMDVVGLGEGNSLLTTTGTKDILKRAGQKLKGGSHHARISLKVCFYSKLN